MQVAKVIRKYGFDIETVASQMGLSKASLSKSICKSGNPAIGKLRMIATIIGADMVEFFEDECKDEQQEATPALKTTDRVKQMMQAKGISVTELSSRMGVLPQSLSRTLRQGSYRVTTLKAIADALGCKVEDITDGVSTVFPTLHDTIIPSEAKEASHGLVCPHCGKPIDVSLTKHE